MIISLDPAVKNGHTGICILNLEGEFKTFKIKTKAGWENELIKIFVNYLTDSPSAIILIETNNGGDWIVFCIKLLLDKLALEARIFCIHRFELSKKEFNNCISQFMFSYSLIEKEAVKNLSQDELDAFLNLCLFMYEDRANEIFKGIKPLPFKIFRR